MIRPTGSGTRLRYFSHRTRSGRNTEWYNTPLTVNPAVAQIGDQLARQAVTGRKQKTFSCEAKKKKTCGECQPGANGKFDDREDSTIHPQKLITGKVRMTRAFSSQLWLDGRSLVMLDVSQAPPVSLPHNHDCQAIDSAPYPDTSETVAATDYIVMALQIGLLWSMKILVASVNGRTGHHRIARGIRLYKPANSGSDISYMNNPGRYGLRSGQVSFCSLHVSRCGRQSTTAPNWTSAICTSGVNHRKT